MYEIITVGLFFVISYTIYQNYLADLEARCLLNFLEERTNKQK